MCIRDREYILDIPFYIRELDELKFAMVYKKELLISGGCILGVWIVAVGWKLRLKNSTNKNERD